MLAAFILAAILPNGWIVNAPPGAVVATGTMPQGGAASADGSKIAVVESGFNPPAVAIYQTRPLRLIKHIMLPGAFGRPVWTPSGIFIAGANANAVFEVNSDGGIMHRFTTGNNSYPVAVAEHHGVLAVARDGDGSVVIAPFSQIGRTRPIPVGEHPGNIAFSRDGSKVFVVVRSGSYIASIDTRTSEVQRIATDLHPSDVLVKGDELYVAHADADTVGVYDTRTGERLDDIFVGDLPNMVGSSPNALAIWHDSILVSLGAANEVVVLRDRRVASRLPAGWYPTDVVTAGNRAYIVDGKGDGTKPNPGFDVFSRSFRDYVAAIQYGSIRELNLQADAPASNPQGQSGFNDAAPASTIVRKDGPIKHVFFILKENRTYDQILGDIATGNGDAKLAWFGAAVTPNQHAVARRFGLFDNFYASGEVSDAGHNWADAAFANDYVERYWPPAYGSRRDADDILTARGAPVPRHGYIWDAARAAHVTFRDYGEFVHMPQTGTTPPVTAASLGDRYDPRYVGWDLDYSDLDRVKEWKREFDRFVAMGTVPRLEYMWLPNDHTYGSRPGKRTPAAYIATNDYAVGLIVQTISHSKIWPSSAIFITEDDAQDGADHVSDQRTTLYIASPYARFGTNHRHYSTLSVLRTIELMLGLQPLSSYDATAVPLYTAFGSSAVQKPFNAIHPRIDLNARNKKTAYGARLSELANFRRPDAVSPGVMTTILSRNRF
jgi:DNA-binding beta-propeller fold protein YncE